MENSGSLSGLHTALFWTIYGVDEGKEEGIESPEFMVIFADARDISDDSCDNLIEIVCPIF